MRNYFHVFPPYLPGTTWCCGEPPPPPPGRSCRPGRCPGPSRPEWLSRSRPPTLSSWRRLRGTRRKVRICIWWVWFSISVWVRDKVKLSYVLSSTQQKKSFETFPKKSLDWLKYFKQTFNQNFHSVWTFCWHWALSSPRHHYNGLLLHRPGPPSVQPPDSLQLSHRSAPTRDERNNNQPEISHQID